MAWGQQVIVRNTAYPGLNTWFSPPSSAPNPADCSTLALTTPNNASYFPDVELKVDAISGLNVTISVKRADGQVLSMDDLYFNVRSGNSWESGLCNDPTNPWVNIDDNHFATGNNVLERTINFDVPSSHPVGTPIIYWVALQQSLPTATSPHSHSYFPLILERVAPCSANITAPSGSTYTTTDAAITLAGSPSGGSFTVNGASATTFDPAALGAGSHTVVYDMGSGCTDTKTVTVTSSTPPPSSCSITAPSGISYTTADAATTLAGTPAGGTFTVNGSSATSFDPAALGVGSHTVEYTEGSCTDTKTITVTAPAPPPCAANITSPPAGATYTTADAPVTLSGTPTSGSFTIGGASATSFDPSSGVGTYTVVYDIGGGCTDTRTVTVTAPPCTTPSITDPVGSAFTHNDNPFNLSATVPSGTWTLSRVGSGVTTTITTSTIDPSSFIQGLYTLSYSTGAGCTATKALAISGLPWSGGNTTPPTPTGITLNAIPTSRGTVLDVEWDKMPDTDNYNIYFKQQGSTNPYQITKQLVDAAFGGSRVGERWLIPHTSGTVCIKLSGSSSNGGESPLSTEQCVTLSGTSNDVSKSLIVEVVDAGTGLPIEGADVTFSHSGLTRTTSATGRSGFIETFSGTLTGTLTVDKPNSFYTFPSHNYTLTASSLRATVVQIAGTLSTPAAGSGTGASARPHEPELRLVGWPTSPPPTSLTVNNTHSTTIRVENISRHTWQGVIVAEADYNNAINQLGISATTSIAPGQTAIIPINLLVPQEPFLPNSIDVRFRSGRVSVPNACATAYENITAASGLQNPITCQLNAPPYFCAATNSAWSTLEAAHNEVYGYNEVSKVVSGAAVSYAVDNMTGAPISKLSEYCSVYASLRSSLSSVPSGNRTRARLEIAKEIVSLGLSATNHPVAYALKGYITMGSVAVNGANSMLSYLGQDLLRFSFATQELTIEVERKGIFFPGSHPPDEWSSRIGGVYFVAHSPVQVGAFQEIGTQICRSPLHFRGYSGNTARYSGNPFDLISSCGFNHATAPLQFIEVEWVKEDGTLDKISTIPLTSDYVNMRGYGVEMKFYSQQRSVTPDFTDKLQLVQP